MSVLSPQIETVARLQPMRVTGRVIALRGLVVLVGDLPLPVGSLVNVAGALGEVVGFDGKHSVIMMLAGTSGIRAGDRVLGLQSAPTVAIGHRLLGRCIDGLGRPIDGAGPVTGTTPRLIDPEPLGAMSRRRITEPMHTGVRAIDLFTTIGRGQRLGIFAGPGVGKSTLLGSIARNAASDVNVVALIGERGREVGDFIAHSLGPAGLARSVVVVSTSDESPLMRIRAAMVACAAAEHFRDQGAQVLLMMDSVTRLAHAQRQIGLSVGEPPATRGYTPSVFSLLARLLERAGALAPRPGHPVGGSITGLYTILVEGDDMTEPVADAARGILDGHLMLSRSLAQRAHFPAIDVLDSVSRVADDVTDDIHRAARRQIIRLMAAYREVEDLVQIGAYAKGSSTESDVAIRYHQVIGDLLRQGSGEREAFEAGRARMVKIALEAGAALAAPTRKA
ncbi:MAG: FliI/YscN family ATPase [Phycisphaeraceae bacterium]|nr:FliI/YscN family ATPase [Phycisphaeraceae bacterium]